MTIEIIRPANKADWLAARRLDVTASVAGALMGVHPYMTAFRLWAEKSGQVEADDEDSPAMRRGRLFEKVAIEVLREERPEWDVTYHADNAYFRDPIARIGATPDAFATRPDVFGQGIVQIKTADAIGFHRTWTDPETGEIEVPLWIAVQAIVEATLTGCSWACVAVMVTGRGVDMHIIDVPLHAGLMRKLRAKVAEFWQMVGAGTRPEIDWMRDGQTVLDMHPISEPNRLDLTGDRALDDMTGFYRALRARQAEIKREADLLRPQIIDRLGRAEQADTDSWRISAPTSYRAASMREPSESRPLRIKPRNQW